MVDQKLYSAVHRVVGVPADQSRGGRHSVSLLPCKNVDGNGIRRLICVQVVYFSHPNSEVMLRSVFEDPNEAAKNEGKLMNADDWAAMQTRNWNKQNYKDASSHKASRGTEHNRDRDIVMLDNPPKGIEAV